MGFYQNKGPHEAELSTSLTLVMLVAKAFTNKDPLDF